MTRSGLLALVAAALLAGCSGGVVTLNVPTPQPTMPVVTTTTVPVHTGATLAGVAGQTTVAVAVGPGSATLSGTVVGPSGPVAAADVHVERLVGDTVGAADVIAQPDGTWAMANVLGGRYRVRAWRSPDLDLTSPAIFFLGGSETKSLTLQLQQFNAAQLVPAIAPNPPIVGQPANLVVQVSTQTVDTKGVVRGVPLAAATVELAPGSAWTVPDASSVVTGPDGTASWLVVCTQLGPQPLIAVVNGTDTYPLNLPPCGLPPATSVPTTTIPPGPIPGATTTTTVKRPTTTTT